MPTINVKDASGNTVTVNSLPAVGSNTSGNSLPVVLASDDVTTPARSAVAITANNSNAISPVPKALYIGTGGTLVVKGVDDSANSTWVNISDGTILPFRAQYLYTTSTANNILALY